MIAVGSVIGAVAGGIECLQTFIRCSHPQGKDMSINEMRKTLAEAKKEFDEANEKLEGMETAISTAEERTKAEEKKAEDAKKEAQAAERRVEKAKEELAEIKKQIEAAKAEATTVRACGCGLACARFVFPLTQLMVVPHPADAGHRVPREGGAGWPAGRRREGGGQVGCNTGTCNEPNCVAHRQRNAKVSTLSGT